MLNKTYIIQIVIIVIDYFFKILYDCVSPNPYKKSL